MSSTETVSFKHIEVHVSLHVDIYIEKRFVLDCESGMVDNMHHVDEAGGGRGHMRRLWSSEETAF